MTLIRNNYLIIDLILYLYLPLLYLVFYESLTMPDLRRQIFESGKTMSRKAASREGSRRPSRAASAQSSKQSSRNVSRHPSDEEDEGNLSDDTAYR